MVEVLRCARDGNRGRGDSQSSDPDSSGLQTGGGDWEWCNKVLKGCKEYSVQKRMQMQMRRVDEVEDGTGTSCRLEVVEGMLEVQRPNSRGPQSRLSGTGLGALRAADAHVLDEACLPCVAPYFVAVTDYCSEYS